MIFDLARKSTHGFESYARQVGRLFAGNRAVLEDLLGGLFHIALADGVVCAAEDQYLREVAHHFGFTPPEYVRIRALYLGAPDEADDDPHHILGVEPTASPDEIRVAYRRLVRENHPDLLMAQGLPPGMHRPRQLPRRPHQRRPRPAGQDCGVRARPMLKIMIFRKADGRWIGEVPQARRRVTSRRLRETEAGTASGSTEMDASAFDGDPREPMPRRDSLMVRTNPAGRDCRSLRLNE